MNIKQIELNRETQFKDAVLSAAEAKSVEIIAEAQRRREKLLAEARASCREADHDLLAARFSREAERRYSALAQEARRDLLQLREGLVDKLFEEARARLEAFTETPEYDAWLEKRLLACLEKLPEGKAATLYLRPADMARAPALEKLLPGGAVQASARIRTGGFMLAAGNRLYDESFSTLLAQQREHFCQTSGLSLEGAGSK